MSTQNLKVGELVKHFADGGDIGAYHTGLGSVVESRVAALVAANKAEQLREHFNLQEATEVEAEEVAAEEGQAQDAAEEQTTAADAEEATEGEGDAETAEQTEGEDVTGESGAEEAEQVQGDAEQETESAETTEAEEPSHITESFRAFARKRK